MYSWNTVAERSRKNLYNSYGEVLRVGFYTVIIASIYWELILYQILFLILFMY